VCVCVCGGGGGQQDGRRAGPAVAGKGAERKGRVGSPPSHTSTFQNCHPPKLPPSHNSAVPNFNFPKFLQPSAVSNFNQSQQFARPRHATRPTQCNPPRTFHRPNNCRHKEDRRRRVDVEGTTFSRRCQFSGLASAPMVVRISMEARNTVTPNE
jgi:hypothetical protein